MRNKKKKLSKAKSVPIKEFLSEKIDFKYKEGVRILINYIEDEGKILIISGIAPKKLHIFLNPASKDYASFIDFEVFKFLVFLERKKFIKDLHLPISMTELQNIDGGKMLIMKLPENLIDDPESFMRFVFESEKMLGKDVRKRLIHFKIENWEKFSKIKKELEKQNKQKINRKREEIMEPEKNLVFDSAKSILFIRGQKIKIRKNSDQYHLLKIIFEDESELSKEWFFSEIAERYDAAVDFPDKKFFNAIYQIKQKIAIETGIKNFFITTNQSVKINDEYLRQT